jgi:hypothetical protein
LNPRSKATYPVSRVDCSSPDFEYRCRNSGIRCKHLVAVNAGLGQRIAA